MIFHIGSLVFGIVNFVLVRAKIKSLKAQLARLENPSIEVSTSNKPPIPDPKNP